MLPEWKTIDQKVEQKQELSALEQFIYANEPAGLEDEIMFRTQLEAVLLEAQDINKHQR